MEKLVLIDGNSLINRAFYANPPMMTKNGVSTGAVFGFINMFLKAVGDIKPDYLAVAFDVKAPTFRHDMYKEYKGTRKPMPDELRPQIPLLKELLTEMNVKIYEKPGWEADDIIGTIAKSTKIQTFIITGDRDSFQLVDDETTVYFTRRGITDIDVVDISNFKEKTGITPAQVTDLKALMGDSSDNIPGVQGVGEKTALLLLQEYGDIDNIYRNADNIKGKLGEKLTSGKEICYLSKKLATIDVNADIDLDTEHMRFAMPFPASVKKKFAELEFKTLIKKEELFSAETVEVKPSAEIVNISDAATLTKLLSAEKFAVVYGKNLNVCVYDGKEYVVKIRESFFDDGMMFDEAALCFKGAFADAGKHVVVYNQKDVMHAFDEFCGPFSAKFDDVSVMKYIADFTGRDEKLNEVIEEYNLDVNTPALSLTKLYKKLLEKIKEEGLEELYYKVELPLVNVLYSMEKEGFKVDKAALESLGAEFSAEMKNLEARAHLLAGEDFNVNSPFQLGTVLFEKLGLKHAKKNKRGYSTSAEILEDLQDEHELVPVMLRYRQLQKLYSTYIEGFKPLIDKSTGLIHTSFNQFVTTTGRLSSKEPNLQNIPIRDELGKEIRRFFIPRDGEHILVGADYSQIELRLLAHFSDCPLLIKAYNDGEDIHTETASRVFGVPKEEVTPQMRRNAKAVNFGIIYGISEFGLGKNLKIPTATAREYISTYFEKYPEVRKFMDSNVAFAKEHGYVSTLLGRKRYIRELNSSNYNVRSFGERAAMNMPLQGSSADIIKIAMVNVYGRLKEGGYKSRLILQVHDELIIDCLKSEQEEVMEILKCEMENAVKLKVPLTVDTEVGETWYDAK